jgi:hypothetical protein
MAAYATPQLELASRSSQRQSNRTHPAKRIDSAAGSSLLDALIDQLAERVAERLAAAPVCPTPAYRTTRTSGSTRGTPRTTLESIGTHCGSSLPSGQFPPSRTDRIASCTSVAPTSMPGAEPAAGRDISLRRYGTSHRWRR